MLCNVPYKALGSLVSGGGQAGHWQGTQNKSIQMKLVLIFLLALLFQESTE